MLVGADLPELPFTLPELLSRAAQGQAGIRHLGAAGTELFQSYADLLQAATRLLERLRAAGLRPQDRVILHCAESQSFLTGLWGCFLGGFVPVPLAVAPDYETENSKTMLLRHAVELLHQPLILTDRVEWVRGYWRERGEVRVMGVGSGGDRGDGGEAEFYRAEPGEMALLLLTSGSTGQPKGVKLTGRNLLAAVYGMATTNRIGPEAVCLNWMPLEHVASLVMFHLTQVYAGCEQIQAENGVVLQAPLQWLDWVNRYRVSHTWAPNFAYGLIAERATEVEARDWDLSCLRWMGNGAEAVVGKTTRRFLELLAAKGLGEVVSPGYGMSETSSGIVHSHEFSRSGQDEGFVEVGLPIAGVAVRIVDQANRPVATGEEGLLQVRGATVMQGYYQRPDLDAAVFTADGWFDTGDLGMIRAGRLTITGRQKEVIVVNGVNAYSHEIEAVVEELPGVVRSFTAACGVRRAGAASEQLAVFCVLEAEGAAERAAVIKAMRRQVMQQIGIPVSFVVPVVREAIPKTSLGKIQRRALAQRFEAGEFDQNLRQVEAVLAETLLAGRATQLPQTQLEQEITQIWEEVLGLPVGRQDNFFELGGNSLLLMQVLQRLQALQPVTATALFQYPTVATLARYLGELGLGELGLGKLAPDAWAPGALGQAERRQRREPAIGQADVAVIGMACRFPGANSIGQFWENLCGGVESVRFFSEAEILASGVDAELLNRPEYVRASPILDCEIAEFDAELFGYSPKEASLLDPQQRLLLECAWETLEDAGYNPFEYDGAIGLYAGASMNTYLLNHVYPNRHQLDPQDSLNVVTLSSLGGFQMTTANDKDYLTTRVSYKLNLTGPSVNVQTACSTSLVAIHLARQSLLNGECDMVLAGGVSVHTPQKVGHLYQDGMILSPDGHCRAFDAEAGGTIFGSGAGLVVLKRLDRAVADGDRIYAVIRGSAIGNDGGEKVGYFAPKASGQAVVTAEAMRTAGIEPETIGYVEAHGTGTALGDPIEIAGLTQAFRLGTGRRQFCAIGSVKTNVGHLNIASGVVGFIKAALCLYHKQIPPSLHFNRPNPQIDFARSPFYVNRTLIDWPRSAHPRRAGVNSLGIGGTNVHVILEEAETPPRTGPEARPQIFSLSAKTPAALEAIMRQYQQFLATEPPDSLADLCFTAQVGRAQLGQRWSRVVTSLPELQAALATALEQHLPQSPDNPQVALLFPGQGTQYVGMGRELYQTCLVFRA
ncbi:MAG: beta-ketoacyl synthase N-terminal-like domain-containing protein, partial [Elainella sp.]